jgi:cytochrome P450
VRTFLGGGVDTTVLGLGSMLMLLATNPQQWKKLCGEPDLARAAFDETLRLTPPAPMVGRTTTGPTELGGVSLGAREKLFLLVGAANRDPRRWEDPDQFDITRNTSGQLAFGLGPHFCVGHAVARLEAEVVLAALIERVERIDITGEQVPELNNWLYGLRHLPVTVTPRT